MARVNLVRISLLVVSIIFCSCSLRNKELGDPTVQSTQNLSPHYGSNCSTCHQKNLPQLMINRFTHSIIGSKSCGECHRSPGVRWGDGYFDHSIKATCLTCHLSTMPTDLASKFKHSNVGSRDCGECHNSPGVAWNDGKYDHQNNQGSCQTCHESNRPEVLVNSFLHSVVKQDCITCHDRPGVTWAGGVFTHVPAPSECSICHESNRPQAPVDNFTHSSNRDCKSCHFQPGISWIQGTTFDHQNITQCLECHLQQKPAGLIKKFNHINIGDSDCISCHHKPGETWNDGVYGHSPAPQSCSICHQGQQPQTGPMIHSIANVGTQDCYSCHTKPGVEWIGAKYSHPETLTTCSQCHEGQRPKASVSSGFNHQNNCAECHGEIYHNAYDCKTCHSKPGVSWTVNPAELKPAAVCMTCHDTVGPHDDGGPHLGPYPASTPASVTIDKASNSITKTPVINWSPSTPGTNPIAYYEAAIFNSDSKILIKDWTNIGSGPSAVMSGLNLPACQPYYVTLRPVDSTGFQSGVADSNSFWVITSDCKNATYKYTGDDQLFLVPTGVSSITINAWGGGGGGSAGGYWSGNGSSFVSQTVSVTAGTWLTIRVGQGGQIGTGGWPNGNPPPLYNWIGGGGGGSSVYNSLVKLIEAQGGAGMPAYSYGGAAGGSNYGATIKTSSGALPGNNIAPCSINSCGQGSIRTGSDGIIQLVW